MNFRTRDLSEGDLMEQLHLSENAVELLKARYLRRNRQGDVVETPESLFERVASAVAEPELQWGTQSDFSHWRDEFLQVMTRCDFLPNSPMLMNGATAMNQLSVCYVLTIGDSIEGIFDAVKRMVALFEKIFRPRCVSDHPGRPGVLMIQIDGLSYRQLRKAFSKNRLPYLQSLSENKGYKLNRFYSGMPSGVGGRKTQGIERSHVGALKNSAGTGKPDQHPPGPYGERTADSDTQPSG